MRDLETIVAQMLARLVQSGSALSDFTPQGVAYTLVRSIASSLQQIEIQQDRALADLDFRTATGSKLDEFCAPFGVIRQGAYSSVGWCLITADSDLTLTEGTVLTELNSGLQFIASEVRLTAYLESPVSIVAAGIGAAYDLPAGTRLYTASANIVSATIGYERKFDGFACGDLVGGTRSETDDSLRKRWYSVLKAGGLLTADTLKTLLIQHPQVIDANVSTPQPGVVRAVVRALERTEALKQDLQAMIQSYLVAAIVKVELVNAKPLTVEVDITPLPGADLNLIKESTEDAVRSYITQSRFNSYFDPQELQAILQTIGSRVEIRSPDVALNWDRDTFVELGNLYVTFSL